MTIVVYNCLAFCLDSLNSISAIPLGPLLSVASDEVCCFELWKMDCSQLCLSVHLL